MAEALSIAAGESRRLRAFVDDLDGWDGQDCDTGTNALLTFEAMARATLALDGNTSLAGMLEAAVAAGIREGIGHVGVLVSSVLAAWADALARMGEGEAGELTPVATRAMLRREPWTVDGTHMVWSVAVESMIDEGTSELETLGDTLPDVAGIVSLFSSQAQYGLVNATSERTGRVDAGAAVLAVLFTSLDAAVREDTAVLISLTQMLADLAGSPGASSPRPQAPSPDRAFGVDIVLRGTRAEATRVFVDLSSLGVRYSSVGFSDLFGVGEWRVHVDTSAPLAVRPRSGLVWRFQVCDARPDELIGEDPLSDVVTHRGARLLERSTLTRVERACVVACTRAPGLVEDLAQAGAVVLLDPGGDDTTAIATQARRSSTGVCLVAPCDEGSADLARRVASDLGSTRESDAAAARMARTLRVLVATSDDDLGVLSVSQACATLFVPRPGGPSVAGIIAPMLEGTAAQAIERSRTVVLPVPGEDPGFGAAVHEIVSREPRHFRVLVGAGQDGPFLVAMLRQVLASTGSGEPQTPDLEAIDGAQPGPSLLQGVR
ncbi:MAG TPA: hypothetical protein VGC18_06715 [Lacisediminihabitans sp.]|uniref:hypothetical protein n=1 Tax=Lacisediminihabitans sp. TaxID=2787631 RepID=UPI002EDB562E